MPKISVSILSADFSNLKGEIGKIKKADFIHIDVMDGVFVPNLTFGFPIIKKIREILDELNLKISLDVHLMTINPHNHVKEISMYAKNSDIITFHYEAYRNIEKCVETLKDIKDYGINAGIAINPETYLQENELENLLNEANILLIMGVHPGYPAQTFIDDVYKKIFNLKMIVNKYNVEKNLNVKIAVDGGIKIHNVEKIKDVDIIVIGSYIFKGNKGNPEENINILKEVLGKNSKNL